MASTLERARDLQRHFLLSVSHDLRTPLTSIRGYAEAITDGTATDVPRAATVIVSESKRLERLVADLLELAKLDALPEVLAEMLVRVRRVSEEAEGLSGEVAALTAERDALAAQVAELEETTWRRPGWLRRRRTP